ncbi:MAG: YlbF family regulator [Clostridia bacterium]|nr:YlbF family regulator [Clostridia bacterium]
MEIFELAAELGRKLKDDPRLIELENAKKAYEEDPALKKYMIEYEVQQKAMQNEIAKPERDMNFIEVIQKRIDTLYKLIAEHPTVVELNRTQGVVNELMNAVNNTIMTQITGEESAGCTHDCRTCGGCH